MEGHLSWGFEYGKNSVLLIECYEAPAARLCFPSGGFTILNLIVSKGKFRAFVGDQQLPIQCEDHWSIIQVNHTPDHISGLPSSSKIPTTLVPTLTLQNKTTVLEKKKRLKKAQESQKLEKLPQKLDLLISSGRWSL